MKVIKLLAQAVLIPTLLLGQITPTLSTSTSNSMLSTIISGQFKLTLNRAHAGCENVDIDCIEIQGEQQEDPSITPYDGNAGGSGSGGGTSTEGSGVGSGEVGTTTTTEPTETTETTETTEPTEPTEPTAEEQCLALIEPDWLVCKSNALEIYNMSTNDCETNNNNYENCPLEVNAIYHRDIAQCTTIKADEIEQCNNMP
jgi:hypothetical protein